MRAGLAVLVTWVIVLFLFELYHSQLDTPEIPMCQVEDGSDVDGQCFWVDPDTGDMYINPTPEEVRK